MQNAPRFLDRSIRWRLVVVADELRKKDSQMPDTQTQVQNFQNKLQEANTAVDRWKQRADPTYVPAPKKTKRPPPVAEAPSDPVDPLVTDDGGGGNTDNGVDS